MSAAQTPPASTRLKVGAAVGVVVLVVLGAWTVSSLTGSTPSFAPSPSAGIGLTGSTSPGSSAGSLPSGSVAPGTSPTAGSSPAAGSSPGATPGKGPTPSPTRRPGPTPTPRPTPAPTPKPVTAIKLGLAYSGFTKPIFVTGARDGTNRLFVVEQTGHIRVIVNGRTQATDFLNISGLINYDGAEQGLLGLAFSPHFRTDGYFYVYYDQANGGHQGNIMIARYTALSGTNVANAGSAKLMIAPIPHTQFPNHNGGDMAFGPDGLLYFGTGDGGSGGNPTGTSQNLGSYLGKMLRMNVNSATPIKPSIWAYGLRNPWRWSFDSATGDLWIGDVGQDRYEEIDHVSRATVLSSTRVNFGWNVWEGRACYPSGTSCSAHGVTMPVAVYAHGSGDSIGCAVIGGYVYRGPVVGLRGNYFYGDECSGRIWRLVAKPGNQIGVQVADTSLSISSFGLDDGNNMYVVSLSGSIYRIGL